MSDRELRKIISEVIQDLDTGRLRPPRPRWRGLKALVGPAALAASISVAVAGCDGRAVGMGTDGSAVPDPVSYRDGGAETADGEAEPADGSPFLPDGSEEFDVGAVLMYGEPFPEFTDAEAPDGSGDPDELDGGAYDLYGVPFSDDE